MSYFCKNVQYLYIKFAVFAGLIPGMIFIVSEILWNKVSCNFPMQIFLLTSGILCLINFCFSLYISLSNPMEKVWKADDQDPLERGALLILCNPLVFLYFLVWMFEIAWMVLGVVWVTTSTCTPNNLLLTINVGASIVALGLFKVGTLSGIPSYLISSPKQRWFHHDSKNFWRKKCLRLIIQNVTLEMYGFLGSHKQN